MVIFLFSSPYSYVILRTFFLGYQFYFDEKKCKKSILKIYGIDKIKIKIQFIQVDPDPETQINADPHSKPWLTPTVILSIASHSAAAYLCAISLSVSNIVLGPVYCESESDRIGVQGNPLREILPDLCKLFWVRLLLRQIKQAKFKL